jgi:drug/metabolite transporter (DMT)-like permease
MLSTTMTSPASLATPDRVVVRDPAATAAMTISRMDFSKLLGAYVAFFALVSVAFGRLVFHETIPGSTWIGVGLALAGSAVIQFGSVR